MGSILNFLLQQTGTDESILDQKRSMVIGIEIKKLNVDDIRAALLDMKYTFFYKFEDLPKVKLVAINYMDPRYRIHTS